MCRKAFLVNADLALRAQLTEFRDHKLIRFEFPISLICRAVLFLLFLFSVTFDLLCQIQTTGETFDLPRVGYAAVSSDH